ncbi:MAG: hypothetical protein LBQ76_03110 [Candidatus Fibromonas sp.]|jgi:hypothetical protein|nr:hypothetical protein [Candidatus Fibromonas sp.]
MTASLFALAILLLISCASPERQPQTSPQPQPVAEQWQPQTFPECKSGEFSGTGVGEHESEALSEAHAALAKQINSSIEVITERMVNQQISNGKENLSSEYTSITIAKAALPNAHDARILYKKATGNKTSIAVCMTKADAAKGFIERQRLIADSLELASNTALKTEHPKHKNEAWHKTQTLWNEFAKIQTLLDGWGIEKTSFYEPANEIYSQAREDYKGYCQTSKLHWKPERETEYSSIAFSTLSKNLKMEKSPCKSNGISLIYKKADPDCSHKFGIYNCLYKPSLSLLSCKGTEYLLLESVLENSHQKQDLALEKLKDSFKAADFWEKWVREIEEWGARCE